MALIRPCADLRNNYNEISKICHQTNKPIYITKNGYNDLVILSNEAYEQLTEENVNKHFEKMFIQKYPDFESFKKEIYEKIEKGLKDIEQNRYRPIEDFRKEMEAKYSIDESI